MSDTGYNVKWTPFRLAWTLRCLRQGTLNIGNDAQNKRNLLNLAIAQANLTNASGKLLTGGTQGWAKWRAGFGPVNNPNLGTSTTSGAGLLLFVPKVPGFVPPVNTSDPEA